MKRLIKIKKRTNYTFIALYAVGMTLILTVGIVSRKRR